jgi:hypothetical protein
VELLVDLRSRKWPIIISDMRIHCRNIHQDLCLRKRLGKVRPSYPHSASGRCRPYAHAAFINKKNHRDTHTHTQKNQSNQKPTQSLEEGNV